jgi:hypothetical protein
MTELFSTVSGARAAAVRVAVGSGVVGGGATVERPASNAQHARGAVRGVRCPTSLPCYAPRTVERPACAQQVLGLVYRQSYQDDPNAGWSQFRDGKKNPSSKVVRHQGLDETASRATQGAFLHWIVGNALLPDVDAAHTGIQKIDRTTVPELNELPSLALSYQTTMDSANARLNPLGLAPGAIAFDLDPYFNNSLGQELADPTVVGKSHYEQLSVRAVQALNNAAGSFNQAAIMTRSLRTQQNQISDFQNSTWRNKFNILNPF